MGWLLAPFPGLKRAVSFGRLMIEVGKLDTLCDRWRSESIGSERGTSTRMKPEAIAPYVGCVFLYNSGLFRADSAADTLRTRKLSVRKPQWTAVAAELYGRGWQQ